MASHPDQKQQQQIQKRRQTMGGGWAIGEIQKPNKMGTTDDAPNTH